MPVRLTIIRGGQTMRSDIPDDHSVLNSHGVYEVPREGMLLTQPAGFVYVGYREVPLAIVAADVVVVKSVEPVALEVLHDFAVRIQPTPPNCERYGYAKVINIEE